MIIRKMLISDLGDIIGIEKSCFSADAWSEGDFSFRLFEGEPRFINLVTEDGGRTIAYITACVVVGEMNIDSVAVSPDYRRRGIATKLINTAVDIASPETVMLEVRESNEGAIALYESLGFEIVGTRRKYYERPVENAILMTKSIEN